MNEQASLINHVIYSQKFVGYLICFSIFLSWLQNLLGKYSLSVFASFKKNLKVKFKLKVFFRKNVFPSIIKACKFCMYHPVWNLSLQQTHQGHRSKYAHIFTSMSTTVLSETCPLIYKTIVNPDGLLKNKPKYLADHV